MDRCVPPRAGPSVPEAVGVYVQDCSLNGVTPANHSAATKENGSRGADGVIVILPPSSLLAANLAGNFFGFGAAAALPHCVDAEFPVTFGTFPAAAGQGIFLAAAGKLLAGAGKFFGGAGKSTCRFLLGHGRACPHKR
jgi:hypothetical protein